jgi:LPS export ABC transporter protein LptC
MKVKGINYRKEFLKATGIFCLIVFLSIGCSNDKKPDISGIISNREQTPTLKVYNVTDLISDSGVTRYRVSAPEWYYYDKAARPYNLFPRGLHFERFDSLYNIDANVDCKYAVWYDKEDLFVLKDSVVCTNLKGERFETNLLNWDNKGGRIYSDSAISIVRDGLILKGIGFESNQTLSVYRILQPVGIIPLDNEETEDSVNTD